MIENISQVRGTEVQDTELPVGAWRGEVEPAINRVEGPVGVNALAGAIASASKSLPEWFWMMANRVRTGRPTDRFIYLRSHAGIAGGDISVARGRPFKCPYAGCGSTDTISKGIRKTKTMGVRRLRYCRSCKRKFTPQNQKPTEQAEEQPMGE